MPAAIVTGLVGAYSAYSANKAAKDGRNAQLQGQQSAIDAQQQARDQARADLQPYSQYGQQAIPLLNQLNSGDYSGFLNSPDYLAARDLGQSQLDHSAAARGGLFGGGNTKDTIQFGGQLASQYLGNYRNSLINQLGGGQNAAAGMGGFSQGAANQIGSAYGNMGQAGANYAAQVGDNNSQLAAGLGGLFANYYNGRASSYGTPTYAGLGGNSTLTAQNSTNPFTAQYGADYTKGMFS